MFYMNLYRENIKMFCETKDLEQVHGTVIFKFSANLLIFID